MQECCYGLSGCGDEYCPRCGGEAKVECPNCGEETVWNVPLECFRCESCGYLHLEK